MPTATVDYQEVQPVVVAEKSVLAQMVSTTSWTPSIQLGELLEVLPVEVSSLFNQTLLYRFYGNHD